MTSDKDIKAVDTLIKTGKAILTLYDELCNLEINNKFFSTEYLKVLDYLDISLSSEARLYEELLDDPHKAVDLISFICTEKNPAKYQNDYELVTSFDFSQHPEFRVKNMLVQNLLSSGALVSDDDREVANEQIEIYKSLGVIPKNYKPYFVTEFDIILSIVNDYMTGFLYFLEDESVNCSDEKIKNKVLNVLYKTTYLYPAIDLNFLDYVRGNADRIITDCCFDINPAIREFPNYDENRIKCARDIYSKEYFRLATLDNIFFDIAQKNVNEIVSKSFIRSSLCFESDESINNLKNIYKSAANISKNFFKTDTLRSSDEVVIDLLNSAKEDRARIRNIIK